MKDIVLRAREDEEERVRLIKSFEPLIKKCIRVYLRDKSYFDDAMQQGYMTVMMCIDRFDVNSGYPFNAYVKRSVIYSIRDFAKKIRFNLSLDEEVNEEGGRLIDILSSDVDIEGDKIKYDDILELYSAIKELPEKQKRVIEDFYFKDISLTEMSKMRRCHYMTVVKLKERAIKTLRKSIKRF